MAWRSDPLPPHAPRRLRRRGAVLGTLAVGFAVLALVTWSVPPMLLGRVLQTFGHPREDARIDAEAEPLEAELMTAHPTPDGRALLSYEYFYEGDLFVGYTRVDPSRAAGLRIFDPVDIEIARTRPELSRLVGTRRAPSARTTAQFLRLLRWSPWLALASAVLAVGALAAALRSRWGLRDLVQQGGAVDRGEEQAP